MLIPLVDLDGQLQEDAREYFQRTVIQETNDIFQ